MSAGVGIAFEDVSISFGGRPVLAGVSLTIAPGERVAFVGPNGGGKTTLVRALLGILRPDAGRVVFFEGEERKEIPRPRIGYLSQRSTLALDAPLSAEDLVAFSFSPEPGFRHRADAADEARRALLRSGLSKDLLETPVGLLSGGQRQRVLLARAIAGAPPLLVLDEPDTALDAEGLATLRRLVSEEVAAGRTVVTVTHDSDAMGGADAVLHVDRIVSGQPVDA